MAEHRLYEQIGHGYAEARRPDDRVQAQITDALGDAAKVLNVGAGTGNYEPLDRSVIAVEPSPTMLAQRTNSNPTIRGFAESLPFLSNAFDVALALFTIHHWSSAETGLAELARVSLRQVMLIYDTKVTMEFWLLDYFPEVRTAPWEVNAPTPEWLGQHLQIAEIRQLMVPVDCTDGFSGAYWGRPEHYLRPEVQAGMSMLARLDADVLRSGTRRLADELDSGLWDAKYGHLRTQKSLDLGYRLVLCEGAILAAHDQRFDTPHPGRET